MSLVRSSPRTGEFGLVAYFESGVAYSFGQ
ncbi:hypothetical protein ABIE49_002551 [Bradyrhizobium sp. OAE829]